MLNMMDFEIGFVMWVLLIEYFVLVCFDDLIEVFICVVCIGWMSVIYEMVVYFVELDELMVSLDQMFVLVDFGECKVLLILDEFCVCIVSFEGDDVES